MSKKGSIKSIEPNIADLANGWLKSYGLDYKLEQGIFEYRDRQGP